MSVAILTRQAPDLAARYAALERVAASRGLAFKLANWDGAVVRNQADTAKAMRYRDADYALYLRRLPAGRTPVPKLKWRLIAPYGASHHNYGAAFDVEIVRGTLAQLGALAGAAGLVWGGVNDAPHYQLPISVSEAQARWLARGNTTGYARLTTAVQVGALMAVALIGGLAALYGRGWKL